MTRHETIMDYNARVWQERRDRRLHKRWAREERAESLGRDRAFLCRQAGIRFGDEISGRFAALLEGVDDFGRLDEIGELIVMCKTGEELLSRTNGGG